MSIISNFLGLASSDDIQKIENFIQGNEPRSTRKGSILKKLIKEQLFRSEKNLAEYREALDFWEDVNNPDRYNMMQIYQEVEQDDAVVTHTTKILNDIGATDIELVSFGADGKAVVNKEMSKLLDSEWFDSLVNHIVDAEMQGYTLIDMPEREGDGYDVEKIEIVPREYVIPEWQRLRRRQGDTADLIDYTQAQFARNLLHFGSVKGKGLYNVITPLWIYKKNAWQFWSNFQEKFGVPPVIAKTDLANEGTVREIVNFLKNMTSNVYALVDRNDEIEALSPSSVDAFKTYDELIKHSEANIAKIIEGQTMTSSDGASLSQAEVHENTADIFHLGRLKRIKRAINGRLLPKMVNDGFALNSLSFRWEETKDLDTIIKRIVALKGAGYKLDIAYVQDATGMPVEEIEEMEEKHDKGLKNIAAQINAYYGIID